MNKVKTINSLEPKTISWYNNQILHVVLLFLVSGSILFPNIRNIYLNDWDEARHAVNALEMIHSENWITVTYNKVPDMANIKFPLGAWLIAINYKLFGINEVSVRLWSVIFTILTTILVYLFGSLIQNRWSGILAALIFITSMQVVTGHAGITGDYDAGASFFVTLSLLIFLFSYKTRKRSFIFLSMAAVGLGIMYKSFVPGLIPIFIISTFVLLSKDKKTFFNLKTLLISALIIIAIISPWLIARSVSDNSFVPKLLNFDYWQRLTVPVDGHSGSFWFYLTQMGDGFYPWIYFLPLGLILVFMGYVKNKYKECLFLLLWFFTIFLLFSIATTKNYWYILPVFPAMAIIVSLFWTALLDRVLELRFGKILFVVLVAFLILNITSAFLNAKYSFYIKQEQNSNYFSHFIDQESVKKELLSSDIIVHEYVITQSNLFYLKRLLNDKFTVSSGIPSCDLKDKQRLLISADIVYFRLYFKNCPERRILSRNGDGSGEYIYALIK